MSASVPSSPAVSTTTSGRARKYFYSAPALLVAFAFSVMADPVSSVAYAIEAALRAMNGDLALLLPAMSLVVFIIGVIIVNYHQLVARFPEGGGAAAAAGAAFGEAWAFIPIGALIVDFVLTIAISVAAASQAVIAYFPHLQNYGVPIALGFLLVVASLTWFGHGGRALFAMMTIVFIALSVVIIVLGARAHIPIHHSAYSVSPGHIAPVAILLAFPVAMALATGVEAPSSAIAQLAQLDDAGRRRFGQITLWLTLGIVGVTTLGITAVAVRLRIGIPAPGGTQIADVARASANNIVYGLFQAFTALLLLAAASSSFQAGPGLLKALARRLHTNGEEIGILHRNLGVTNRHHTPYWAALLFLAASASIVIIGGGNAQTLVLFYAVSVFMSFLVGLLAMTKFSLTERHLGSLALNLFGAVAVAFTLVVNLVRGRPTVSVGVALLVAFVLQRLWVRAGRPRGIAQTVLVAESGDDRGE